MNYRHAFHAGNHGDVLKHIVLTRILAALARKEKPYRVIDAYAGAGIYDLSGVEAGKTGEWQGGIGKLGEPFPSEIETLLAPYRATIAALNPDRALRLYPGSPEIALGMMRAGDRLIANELHPEDGERLARHFAREPRVKVMRLDAEICVKASLPPPERRGLILIDPPYEQKDEAAKALRMLAEGLTRFATGIFMLWYPLKGRGEDAAVPDGIRALGCRGALMAELRVREAFKEGGLAGSGVVVVNAPWKLDEELETLLPPLARRLGLGNWGEGRVEWLTPLA
ncbi:MAG: 23S rRNA (adenine(2030)-N(6))-methyltransferase RlmJ [Rhodomicrobium sp.]|nr:23S rRNA (adenine(2030)-N(6))-methyltransferase RlmJ [Rhodomicrobium sp.]